MSNDLRIALIGFGEVGQLFACDLASLKYHTIKAWDVKFTYEKSIPSSAIKEGSAISTTNVAEAVQDANIIISAVTAAETLNAAKSVAPFLTKNTFFVDLNSASPATKEAAAQVINNTGAMYIEAAIMSPIALKRLSSPILLGGPHAMKFQESGLMPYLTGVNVFSDKYGEASAAKMCRSVIVKGMEAILTESMLTARYYGVEDTVLKSLHDLFPGTDWGKRAHYMIARSIEHGTRRAEEMQEVANTVYEAGLSNHMSLACVQQQNESSAHQNALEHTALTEMLDKVLHNIKHDNCPQSHVGETQ